MKRAERLLLGIAAGAAAAVIAYAMVRVAERAFFPEPNPRILIWSDRSPFAWRAAIALYTGGLAAFGGYALASRSPRATPRWLSAAITLATIAIVVQAVLAP